MPDLTLLIGLPVRKLNVYMNALLTARIRIFTRCCMNAAPPSSGNTPPARPVAGRNTSNRLCQNNVIPTDTLDEPKVCGELSDRRCPPLAPTTLATAARWLVQATRQAALEALQAGSLVPVAGHVSRWGDLRRTVDGCVARRNGLPARGAGTYWAHYSLFRWLGPERLQRSHACGHVFDDLVRGTCTTLKHTQATVFIHEYAP